MVLLILMCVIGGLNPLGSTLKGATGKIALFQGSVAAISYVSLFCSYVAMKMGCDVYMPYALLDAFNLISCFFCIYLCCRDVKMSYFYYLYSYLRMCLAYALAIGIAWLLRPSMEATFVAHALHSVFTLAFYAASVYLIGFNKTEKTFLLSIIKRKS
jgi:type IV secretory pathway TrbL component